MTSHVPVCIVCVYMQGFLTVADKERHVGEILLSNRDKMEALVSELLTKFDKDKKYCPEPGKLVNTIILLLCLRLQ